jgi:hypothetical protein
MCPTALVPPDVRFFDVPKKEPPDEQKPLVVDCSAIFKTTPPEQSAENVLPGIDERKVSQTSSVNELFTFVSTSRTTVVLDQMDSLRTT